jgi:hypothetical protein
VEFDTLLGKRMHDTYESILSSPRYLLEVITETVIRRS